MPVAFISPEGLSELENNMEKKEKRDIMKKHESLNLEIENVMNIMSGPTKEKS